MIDVHDTALSLDEAAAFMRLGQKALVTLIDAGEIPAARLNQKHTAILRSDAIAYLHRIARVQQIERQKQVRAANDDIAITAPRRKRGRTLPDLAPYEKAAGIH